MGTDAIRILEDGAFNLIVQSSLSPTSAVTFDVELDDRNRFEVGYKAYSSRYHSGVYYQAGLGLHDAGDGNEIGISAKIGYEHSPARNFVFFGTVQGEYLFTASKMVYTPKLGAMLTF